MSEDPAVTKAKELWKDKQYREAMVVLVQRINELNALLGKAEATNRQRSISTGVDSERKGTVRTALRTCFIVSIVGFVGCFALFLTIGLLVDSDEATSKTPQSPSAEVVASTTPAPNSTPTPTAANLQRFVRDAIQNTVRGNASITDYDAKINRGGRLEADIILQLSGSSRDEALDVIESTLVAYARSADNRAGFIHVFVSWKRSGQQCQDNAGMGYAIMETIDWSNPNQRDIFEAIDRQYYADRPGQNYRYMGFAPDESFLAICNE